MKKSLLLLTLLSVALHAQVPLKGSTVDATQGYTVNGAAPSNQILCGNGTRAVFAASCGMASVPFYQTIQSGGVAVPQRLILNFDGNFAVNDSSPSTTVHLASTITSNTSGNASTATNATTANALAATPTQCASGSVSTGVAANGNANCIVIPGASGTLNNLTGSRGFGVTYTNSGSTAMYVSGYGTTPSGGSTSQVNCTVNGITVYSAQYNATVTNGSDAFTCMVPPGGTYSVSTSGTTVNLAVWTEYVF